ncbi:MAG: zinc ribbon domain-containing protein [Lachnospiraceae bacterium]|nr:zinc ribbon domain-containing protein [Lachnospiraceae bacterium]
MAKFCQFCGQSLPEDAVFCKYCGKKLLADPAAEKMQQAFPEKNRAPKKEAAQQIPPNPTSKTGRTSTSAKAPPRKAETAPEMRGSSVPGTRNITAPAVPGEIDCGEIILAGLDSIPVKSAVTEEAGKVLSPIAGIFSGLGAFIVGIFGIFKRPAALIGTILLAVLWFVLAQMQYSDSDVVRTLSFLTFAQGGFEEELPAMVGGILGKGTVGAALISLLTGGLKHAFSGFGVMFTGHGEKRGILSILFGFLAAIIVYVFISGINPAPETAMAGIAGSILSLEALGSGSGRLYNLAQSLTSRVRNGVRTAAQGKCGGLLTGLALGFAFSAISAFYV